MREIVIKIDENVFTRLFDNGMEDYAIVNDDLYAIAKAIRNGTPLPKGHGDLIERRCGNKVCNGCEHSDICDTYNAPTIIEGSDSE